MEQYYNNFIGSLKSFVVNLGTYCPDYDGVHKFINVFEKLDMGKVIARYNSITHENYDNLVAKNDNLVMNSAFNIFPGINLSKCWDTLNDAQKNALWFHLHSMYVSSSYIMEMGTNVEMEPNKKQCVESIKLLLNAPKIVEVGETVETEKTHELINKINFNPYEGIGTDTNDNFGVNELMSGPKTMPGEKSKDPMGGFSSFLNMSNMFDMEKLSDQLKKISAEDIEQATDTIKKLIGDDIDADTSDVITDLLTNITDELKSDKNKEGDPIKNIMGIANTIAEKMGPKIKNQNMDITKLMGTTKNIAAKCKDADGNNVFGKNDPFMMMSKMFENQMKMHDAMKNKNNDDNNINEQDECLNDCQKIFADMGIDNINEDDLKNFNIGEMMSKLMTPPQNHASK